MAARREYNPLTEELLQDYLDALEKCGKYIVASDAVGIRYGEIKTFRDQNPEYNTLCLEAVERYRVRFLEEAERRALEGFERPIIGGRERDQVVAVERVVSDRLLELFIKRGSHDERFTEKQDLTVTGGLDLKKEFEFHKMSKTARRALRSALEVIKSENEKQLTDGATPGDDEGTPE